MPLKTNQTDSEVNQIDNDTDYLVCARRRSERRGQKLLQGVISKDINRPLQQMTPQHSDLSSQDERRRAERRNSTPTLLSVEEITVLRKQ